MERFETEWNQRQEMEIHQRERNLVAMESAQVNIDVELLVVAQPIMNAGYYSDSGYEGGSEYDSDSSLDADEYEVDDILDSRDGADGQEEYLVKWKGYEM